MIIGFYFKDIFFDSFMIIKIFSDFSTSLNSKLVYERLCETHLIPYYGKGNDVFITTDDDYTHAIILNTAMPFLKIPKERVIGFAFEPLPYLHLTPIFINYAINR